MSGPAFRLLACDLDGTILRDNKYLSKRVKTALFQVREQGIQVALATGRSYHATLPFARLLDIRLPIICYQGGLIQHPGTGKVVHKALLPEDLVQEAIELSRARDWQILLYTAKEILLTEYRLAREIYGEMFGPTVRRIDDLSSAIDLGVIKMTIMAPEGEIPSIHGELGQRFAGRLEIVRSHSLLVEAAPPGTSKATGLAWLAEHLAVPRRQIMAIGDQDNDAPMVAWAGLGVAMGNGSPLCKRMADWIAPTIDEDGSAVAIERFLLSSWRSS